MATEFTFPSLGEAIESATLVKMLVEPGDTVEEEQAVMEVEVEKGVMEVPSSVAGTVGEILVKAGDKVTTGQKVFTLSGASAAAAPEAVAAKSATAKQGSGAGKESAGQVGASPSGEQAGLGAATDLPGEGG